MAGTEKRRRSSGMDGKFHSDFISDKVKITVEKFKELFKAQNEDFETSAFEFENKTIENVINDLKSSFNLMSFEEEEQSNSNFKTGKERYS